VQITNHDLQTIKTIARMAASVCQTIQEEMVHPAQKDGREPVTIADYASQALIGNALASNYPDDAVLSEERSEEFMLLLDDAQRALVQRYVTDAVGGYVFEEEICAWLDYGKQKTAERTWVIDPIDGTKGFLARRHYCVAIGLLVDFKPVLGVLASPGFYSHEDSPREDIGALISARQGGGAYIEPLFGGEPEPIHVSSQLEPASAVLLTSYESAHTDRAFLARIGKALGRGPDSPEHQLDSQDKHAMIAAGMGDIFIRLAPDNGYLEKMWDHCAGHVIVTEAGGRITDIYGRELDFSTGRRMTRNRGIVVTNRYLHDTVLEAIRKSAPPGWQDAAPSTESEPSDD